MVPGILLAGEPMGLYIAQEEGLTRLGHRVEYLTRLGCDPDGERIRRALRETGVGDALVITDPERPTGIMFKGRVSRGDPPIFYRRRGSAAAALISKPKRELLLRQKSLPVACDDASSYG